MFKQSAHLCRCYLNRVWDVRKLQKIAVPDDKPAPIEIEAEDIEAFIKTSVGKTCMRGEWRHGKSVSSAFWDPHGRRVLSTSYDDTLRRKSRVTPFTDVTNFG